MAQRATCIACSNEYDYDSVKFCPKDGTPLTPLASKPSLIGQEIDGRYRIKELVGEGKTGNVYKAEQLNVDRIVALKVLHAHLLKSDEAIGRFRREAKATSQLRHPALLTILDFGIIDEQQPYMVTEYLDGTTIESIVEKEGSIKLDRALPIFTQICAGMAVAHEQQVIHRDIKPSNIVLVAGKDSQNVPKVIDFGLVKFLDDDEQAQLTQSGQITGTPAYISPEQCTGQKLDTRTDIYSLACVIYFALTGKPPFESDNIADMLFKKMKEAPPAFASANPQINISGEIERVVFKALEKDVESRFQSMKEFQSALERAYSLLTAPQPEVQQKPETDRKVEVADQAESTSQQPTSTQSEARGQRKQQQHVMYDVEKGSNKLVARDQYKRVDEKQPEAFDQMRKRQTEDLSERILRSVKSSFVGDQTMAWLQNVNENINVDTEQADQQFCQLSISGLIDKLFDDFQRYAYQFNQTEENREFVVSCMRPSRSKMDSDTFEGHLQNSIWAMRVVGDSQSVRFTFLQTQYLYRSELMSPTVFLEMKVQVLPQGPAWCIDGKPLYLSQLPLLSKKVFARLMRVSRGEVSENEILRLDMAEEQEEASSKDSREKERRQDPGDVITYSFISILEAIDEELLNLRQEGMEAMKRGGIDAVSPVMIKTKQYDSLREKTAELAKEWAGMLS